jgi:hypothetical protein
MLKIPLPTNKLKSRILEYPNLERYCDKILHLYFPTGKFKSCNSTKKKVFSNEEILDGTPNRKLCSASFACIVI